MARKGGLKSFCLLLAAVETRKNSIIAGAEEDRKQYYKESIQLLSKVRSLCAAELVDMLNC